MRKTAIFMLAFSVALCGSFRASAENPAFLLPDGLDPMIEEIARDHFDTEQETIGPASPTMGSRSFDALTEREKSFYRNIARQLLTDGSAGPDKARPRHRSATEVEI